MIRCADGHRIFLATFLKLSETLISNLQSIQDSFHKCPSSDVNIRRWALLQSSAFHALLRVPCANHAGNQFFAQRIRHVSLCLCVMLKADNIECVLTWRCCVVCVDEGLTVQQRWRWPTEQPSLFRRQHSQLSNHQYSLHSEHISITLSYTLTAHPCRHTRWRTTHRCTMSQQHQCWQSHAVRCLNMLCCKLCHQNRRTHEVRKLNHHLDCSLCVCVCVDEGSVTIPRCMTICWCLLLLVVCTDDVLWIALIISHASWKYQWNTRYHHLHCYFHWKSLSHWRKIDRESHTHCERAPFVVVVEINEKNMLSSRRRTIHTWCKWRSCVPHADTPCWCYKHHFVSLSHVATP